MNEEMTNESIDLLEIAKRVWLHKLPIIALAVVLAVLFAVRVEFFVADKYTAGGTLYISNQSSDALTSEISMDDMNTAKSMTETYKIILQTRSFLSEVSQDIGGRFSWKQIKNMSSMYSVNETEVLQIDVTANTPEEAYLVAESLVRNAPNKLDSIFPNGHVAIVDAAVFPEGPVGKGVTKQALMGFAMGLFLGVAVVVISGYFDTKVRKNEEVSKRYNVSILGEITQ